MGTIPPSSIADHRRASGRQANDYPVRLPRRFIQEAWRFLTSREKAILPVLEAHRPHVHPGRDRIGKLAGLGRSSVSLGISEMEGVALLTRRQRRTTSGRGFSTNRYVLADLREPAILSRVLANLSARALCDRISGHRCAADPVTGRPEIRSQSHHQGKSNQRKSRQPRAERRARRPTRGVKTSRSGHDDDGENRSDLAARLPDGADGKQIAAVLTEYYGPDGKGRAWKQAHRRHMTAAVARRGLTRALPYCGTMKNRGAYIAGLIDGELAEAAEADQRRQRKATEVELERRADIEQLIDQLPDAELQGAIDSCPTLPGLTADAVRHDPAFREELVRSMANRGFNYKQALRILRPELAENGQLALFEPEAGDGTVPGPRAARRRRRTGGPSSGHGRQLGLWGDTRVGGGPGEAGEA